MARAMLVLSSAPGANPTRRRIAVSAEGGCPRPSASSKPLTARTNAAQGTATELATLFISETML